MSLELAYQFGTQRIKFIEAISHSCRTLEYIFKSNDDIELVVWMFRGERDALLKLLIDFLKFYSDYECLLSNCPDEDVYGKNLIENAYKLLDSAPDHLKDHYFVNPVLEEVPLRNVSVVSPPSVQEVAYIFDKVLNVEKLRNASIVSPPSVQEVAHYCDKVSTAAIETRKFKFVRIKYSYLEPNDSTETYKESEVYFEENHKGFAQSI